MRPVRPVAACLAAVALAACGGGTPSAGPAPSVTATALGPRAACDLLSLSEAAAVLHVASVREPSRADRTRCTWVPTEQSAATAYFTVALDAGPGAFDDARAVAEQMPGYHALPLGDAAFFYDGALRVRKGGRAFSVVATSDVDRTSRFSHVETHARIEYQRIATEAARLVATRV